MPKSASMSDSAGKPVRQAYPGMAGDSFCWKELPNAGDEVLNRPRTGREESPGKPTADSRSGGYPYRHGGYHTQRMEERRKVEGGGEEDEKVQEVVPGLKN